MNFRTTFLLLILFSIPMNLLFGQIKSDFLVDTRGKYCKHGLHNHPNMGPFSVYVFCDDGGGSNIGIILTEPGAGPGKLKLTGSKTWDSWDLNDRFWQDISWATDVHSFAWGAEFRFIYVSTSSVYGEGGLYKLDLQDRTSKIPSSVYGKHQQLVDKKGVYDVYISKFFPKTNSMTVELGLIDYGGKILEVSDIIIE